MQQGLLHCYLTQFVLSQEDSDLHTRPLQQLQGEQQVEQQQKVLWIQRESRGGSSINRNPATIRSTAANFHVEKRFTRRARRSTRALTGIPSTVPSDMNSG